MDARYLLIMVVIPVVFAAPPIFEPVGEERLMNSNLYVVEGEQIEFTINASDPDGDTVTFSADGVPVWGSFNPLTRTYTGTAPLWADDYETRKDQQGIFDIIIKASDGSYNVEKIVTVNVLESEWTPKTMAELVAERPISSGDLGSPVDIQISNDETVWTDFGGGKNLRKITFGFTSQVPAVSDWGFEDDWDASINYLYLPLSPAVYDAGGIVEGAYAMDWGREQMAERACAELDIPVLIINRNWVNPEDVPDPHVYSDMAAVNFREPEYLWAVFASAHFLRAADAFEQIIREETDWPDSNMRFVFTGLSKFGYNCWATAAVSDRTAGFMSAGWEVQDHDAYRLLAGLQGGQTMTVGKPDYLGTMMKYYTEPLGNQDEMNSRAMLSGTTNDMRSGSLGTMSKFAITASSSQLTIPYGIGMVPNLGHTTISDRHSTYWRMWLAHLFLDRPISSIDYIDHYPNGGSITVMVNITGPVITETRVWATAQNDRDTSDWDGFASYPMVEENGLWVAEIPLSSTAYYIEIVDQADNVDGLISSAIMPVDKDYPLLPQSPGPIKDFASAGVQLSWTNPDDTDYAGVTISYRTDTYPDSPLDGTQIYDGQGTEFNHEGISGTVYYSAFSYDSLGHYSDAATLYVIFNSQACDEADVQEPFGEISTTELIQFLDFWKLGSKTIESLIDAIDKWKNGC